MLILMFFHHLHVNENNKLSKQFINSGPLVIGYGSYVLGISADLAVRTLLFYYYYYFRS